MVESKIADGYKNIEDVKVGDLVWAFDEKTEQLELKPVINTFVKVRDHIYKIYADDEVIEATEDHPFFIGGKWVAVKDLKIGDALTLYNGSKIIIDDITYQKGEYKVYNFEVSQLHTYYVSKQNVLVHNSGPCKWQSTKTFGHAFTRHGAGNKNRTKLIGRLETGNPQGQWINNQEAADFLMNDDNYKIIANLKPGEAIDINLPKGMGEDLSKVDGKVVTSEAVKVTVVRGKDNFIKTAIPKTN